MENLTITIGNKKHEMRTLTGRDWRVLCEFREDAPQYQNADFLERHANFIANFFPAITIEELLDQPLSEILPLSNAIQQNIIKQITSKFEQIEKNVKADKAQQN